MCDLPCGRNTALNHILYTILLTFRRTLLAAFYAQKSNPASLSNRERAFLRAASDGDQVTIAALLNLNTNIDLPGAVSTIISMITREN